MIHCWRGGGAGGGGERERGATNCNVVVSCCVPAQPVQVWLRGGRSELGRRACHCQSWPIARPSSSPAPCGQPLCVRVRVCMCITAPQKGAARWTWQCCGAACACVCACACACARVRAPATPVVLLFVSCSCACAGPQEEPRRCASTRALQPGPSTVSPPPLAPTHPTPPSPAPRASCSLIHQPPPLRRSAQRAAATHRRRRPPRQPPRSRRARGALPLLLQQGQISMRAQAGGRQGQHACAARARGPRRRLRLLRPGPRASPSGMPWTRRAARRAVVVTVVRGRQVGGTVRASFGGLARAHAHPRSHARARAPRRRRRRRGPAPQAQALREPRPPGARRLAQGGARCSHGHVERRAHSARQRRGSGGR